MERFSTTPRQPRHRGGIEPLPAPEPQDLKSCLDTSPSRSGNFDMRRSPPRKQLRSATVCRVLSSLQSLAPKANALSIRPQDPLVASQATITYPLPELPTPLSFSNGFFNAFPIHLQNLFKTFPIISWRLVQDFPHVFFSAAP